MKGYNNGGTDTASVSELFYMQSIFLSLLKTKLYAVSFMQQYNLLLFVFS